jgi:hypothetical protein
MEKTVSERKQCPYCKNWEVYEAYNEYGKFGDWCPHCKKGIATEYEINLYKKDSKKYFNRLCALLIFLFPLISIKASIHLYEFGYIFYVLFVSFMMLFSIFAGLALRLQNQYAIKILKIFLLFLCFSPIYFFLYHVIIRTYPSEILHSQYIGGYFGALSFAGAIYLTFRSYLKTNENINNTLIRPHEKKG